MAPVQVDQIAGRTVVVTSGLKAGDRVILDNLQKLRVGMPVAARPEAPAAPSTPAAK